MEETLPCYIDYQTYANRFKFIRKAKDSVLGDVHLVKDTQYNRTLLVKERILKTKEEIARELDEYAILYKLNECLGSVKFLGYTYKLNKNVTPNVYHYISLREYYEHDFEREMANRLRNKVNAMSPIATLMIFYRMSSPKRKSGRSRSI